MACDNRGYGVPPCDLIGEGNVSLTEAAYRFATYAQWWIRTMMLEYVLRNWSSVRIGTTPAQRKLFFNLARTKRALGVSQDGELSAIAAAGIAARLDVPPADVVEMDRRLAHADFSLSAPVDADGEVSHQDLLVDGAPDQETALAEAEQWRKRRQLLVPALAGLGPRERQVLTARRLAEPPKPLKELAAAYGVPPERVRQIESRALEKLAVAVGAAAAAAGLLAPVAASRPHLPTAA